MLSQRQGENQPKLKYQYFEKGSITDKGRTEGKLYFFLVCNRNLYSGFLLDKANESRVPRAATPFCGPDEGWGDLSKPRPGYRADTGAR